MPRTIDYGDARSRSSVSDRRPPFGYRALVIGVVAIFVALWVLIDSWNAFQSGETGQIGIIRNGGPLDNKEFRGILPVNAGPTWIGYHSSVRFYPATERYDNFVPGEFGADPSKGDTLAVDAYRTNTRDGMNIGIKGQFKYTVNQDPDVLAKFDQDYGQRTYPVPGDPSKRLAVSEGDDGFAVFLDSQVRPLEEETIRQVVSDRKCTDFDASCTVLTQGNNADPAAIQQALNNAPSNSAVFQDVANRIASLMTQKLSGLGGPYLQNVVFFFTGVDLPQAVRDAINRVQTAGAGAAEAQANAARATAEANGRASVAAADATANENRQRGYNLCTTCADLDRIRANGDAAALANSKLPAGLQVYGGDPNLNVHLPTLPAR